MTNIEAIKKLKHILLTKQPVLFTGAGFSLGAKQSNNMDPIPNGEELKMSIIQKILCYAPGSEEYKELKGEPLPNVCEHANLHHQNQLQDYLTEIFTDCKPEIYHKTICSYHWSRIYTTNIDDVVENCIDNRKLLVQNLSRIKTGNTDKLEYIKLHGCVRNQEKGYVFSEKEYVDSMLKSRDYRFNSFGQDIQYKEFIFIGTDFNEINLDYYLRLYENAPTNTSKGFLFFINPSTRILFRSIIENVGGIIIDWRTNEFADFLSKEIFSENIRSIKITLKNFNILNNKVDEFKTFKAYRSNLYVGDIPRWLDILNDWDFHNVELWKNFMEYYSWVQANDFSHSVYTLVGKSLAGKSTYSRRICYFLYNEGYTVLEFTGKNFEYYSIIQFCKKNEIHKLCILVDNEQQMDLGNGKLQYQEQTH